MYSAYAPWKQTVGKVVLHDACTYTAGQPKYFVSYDPLGDAWSQLFDHSREFHP